jgi:hypothetical protein
MTIVRNPDAVVGGVDTHADVHVAAVVNHHSALLRNSPPASRRHISGALSMTLSESLSETRRPRIFEHQALDNRTHLCSSPGFDDLADTRLGAGSMRRCMATRPRRSWSEEGRGKDHLHR